MQPCCGGRYKTQLKLNKKRAVEWRAFSRQAQVLHRSRGDNGVLFSCCAGALISFELRLRWFVWAAEATTATSNASKIMHASRTEKPACRSFVHI